MKLIALLTSIVAGVWLAAADTPTPTDPSAGSPPSAAVAPTPSESAEEEKKGDAAAAKPPANEAKKEEPEHNVHDFSHLTGRDEDSCGACHVPHLDLPAGEESPPASVDDGPFVIRRQRAAATAARHTPGPTSMICLSCHNGSVASSTIGAAHAMFRDPNDRIGGGFDIRDHPIGVVYPVRAEGYRPRAAVESDGRVKLSNGRVECISCHDHHEEEGNPHLLVMPNKRSALCLVCHEK